MEGWDGQELHFSDKLFVKATTRSILHIPLNMSSVFPRTFAAIEAAQAGNADNFIVMSHDPSAWKGEHFFSVDRDVPGQEMVRLTGNYLTRVFEGPYKDVRKWENEMAAIVASRGRALKRTYYFYTTCPKCAKQYGSNYVVAVAEVQ